MWFWGAFRHVLRSTKELLRNSKNLRSSKNWLFFLTPSSNKIITSFYKESHYFFSKITNVKQKIEKKGKIAAPTILKLFAASNSYISANFASIDKFYGDVTVRKGSDAQGWGARAGAVSQSSNAPVFWEWELGARAFSPAWRQIRIITILTSQLWIVWILSVSFFIPRNVTLKCRRIMIPCGDDTLVCQLGHEFNLSSFPFGILVLDFRCKLPLTRGKWGFTLAPGPKTFLKLESRGVL